MRPPVSVTGRTELLGIIADPVAQARAPGLINAAFAARGRDAVMVALHVGPDGLARVVDGLRAVRDRRGCRTHAGLPMFAAQIEQMIDFIGG
jgi:hypothetical protein